MRDILCIGSVLWDMIGRSASHMAPGADAPGRITRQPGGVALNIGRTLLQFGVRPVLLSAVGRDRAGDDLVAECAGMGMETCHIWRSDDLPTDRYMAIEGANGLIAAIADAHSLEIAGSKILYPLQDGKLGSLRAPYTGLVALDGNLTLTQLEDIAHGELLRAADLRIAPASPGKAERLLPFLQTGRGTLYLNLEEAEILCQCDFATAAQAAETLLARGAARAIVTNGVGAVADGDHDRIISGKPPDVMVTRVTGAGDTFMAAHIAAEASGEKRETALEQALAAAARHISGDTPL